MHSNSVISALSGFERSLTLAKASRNELSKERGALQAEATRIHREISDRFRRTVAARFNDADALLKVDAGHGDPLRLHKRMETLRSEAAKARQAHGDHMSRVPKAPSAEVMARADEARSVAKSAWDVAASAKDESDRVVDEFDQRFLRAREIVRETGIDDTVLKAPPLLARTLNPEVIVALRAIKAFEKATGKSYWTVRDSEYQTSVERRDAAAGHERAAWTSFQSADADASALRVRRDKADEHAANAAALDRVRLAAEGRLRSPMNDLAAHAGAGLLSLLGTVTEEALAGKPGRATTAMGRLAEDGLVVPGDIALAGHAVWLMKIAESLGKPIGDMDGLASRLSKGKDKLAKAAEQGGGSQYVSIDLSSIERAVRTGRKKIVSVVAEIGRIRTPKTASAATARGLAASSGLTPNAMVNFLLMQAEGVTSPVPSVVDAPSVNVDVPDINVRVRTIPFGTLF